MTLLVVGVSHRTAAVPLLDRVAVPAVEVPALLRDVVASEHVAEAMLLSTCNRVEVYADVTRFHGALVDIAERLAKRAGLLHDELGPYLYVHYEDRAVLHLFSVAAGLDSMVIGEAQVLGQVRAALQAAQHEHTAGRVLNDVGQSALRVGKRVHADTGIDRAGQSVVSVALQAAAQALPGGLVDARCVVVGAGAMSSLAATSLRRAGAGSIAVLNRSAAAAARLADTIGGTALPLTALREAMSLADVVVSCTGSTDVMIDAADVAAALSDREPSSGPIVVVDLALPHDTDPAIASLPAAVRIDIAALVDRSGSAASETDVERARAIVTEEVAAFVAAQAAARVEPVVVSLRARADTLVDAELGRLRLRLSSLSTADIAEVERSIRRTVQALLHTPTVRMKQLAVEPDGTRYAAALHALFDLDPAAVQALSAPAVPGLEDDHDVDRADGSDPRRDRADGSDPRHDSAGLGRRDGARQAAATTTPEQPGTASPRGEAR